MSPLPWAQWPYYEQDPPQYPCVADHTVIHEGDEELEDCSECLACPDCGPRSMCVACADDHAYSMWKDENR